MMKVRTLMAMAATLLSMSSPVLADSYYADDCCYQPSYCEPACCENQWRASIDWLYWATRTCKLDYAIPFDGTAVGSVHLVEPGYDNGFRIGFERDCNCWTYGMNYTFYRADANDTLIESSSGDIGGTRIVDAYTELGQGNIDLARANWDLDYDVVELNVGRDVSVSPCFTTHFNGGLRFAFIDQKLDILYSETTDITGGTNNFDRVNQKNNMDGYGIGFGLTPEYNIWNCFSLFGNFGYDVYAAKFDKSFTYKTSTDGGSTIADQADLNQSCWRLVSVVHLSLGFKVTKKDVFCRNSDLTLAFGYEFHNWLNSAGFLDHTNESGEVTVDRYNEALGFDGLFVRLTGTF